MHTRWLACLALMGTLFCSRAHAHISVEQGGTHKSRYGDGSDAIKEGPCGVKDGKRGTNVYTYQPGETITVKVVEYVPHPGYFRIAFDADGDDDFKDPESIKPVDPNRGCPAKGLDPNAAMRDRCDKDDLYNTKAVLPDMDNLKPHVEPPSDTTYTFSVKLPDVECDNCTLQIIQVMEDPIHGPYNVTVSGLGDAPDVYHQCIDLVLKRGGSAGTGGSSVAAAGGKGGDSSVAAGAQAAGGKGGEASPAAGAAAPKASSDSSGGCSIRSVAHRSGAHDWAWLGVGAVALSTRARKRWRVKRGHG